MNVWRYTPGSKTPVQVTRFKEFGVRNMSAGDGVLVFTAAGAIHTYDPKAKEYRRLSIKVHADGLGRLPRWQAVKGFVRSAAIAPNGKRAAFEARGEIVTVPREHGAARNLTSSPGSHERSPAWSPDGERIAWFSDEGGEYRLVVRDRLGREPPQAFDLGGVGFYNHPQWSPDGKRILFNDKSNRIAYLTLETGEVTDVAQIQGSLGEIHPWASWSPDSEWVAYEHRNPVTAYDGISLYEVETGETTPLTDGFSTADSPAFSKDGKHLFFRASVDSGPRRFGLDLSVQAVRRSSGNLYVVVLKKDGKNPLGARSDEGLPEKEKKKPGKKPDKAAAPENGDEGDDEAKSEGKKDDDAGNGKKKDAGPSIDVDGIQQRILALPLGASRYEWLVCSKAGLLFIERPEGGTAALKQFDFKSRKAKEIVPKASRVHVSPDGKHLLVLVGSSWALANENGKDRKNLAVDKVKVRVEPAVEWPQILKECWRIQRDYFYDPNLHHVDWQAMWERWSRFLPHVQHRADLNVVMMEMMGELCCGHEYVYGGDYPRAENGVSVGLLGADVEVHEGRHRIARIYAGQNWNPRQRAPLTAPGVDVEVGDYLISVNGRPLQGDRNVYEAFQNTADQPVELEVSATPDGKDSRTSTVVPIGSDGRLRRMAWVEANRRRVDELSGGRLAYVYMPNTARSGLAAFDRDFYSQLDKQGLILDERFNGGGKVADYIVDVLDREVLCYWMNREGWLGRTPFGTLDGPKVMVINERAGSGGDCMPWMFRKLGLGPLVGTRTWGGLVGVSGYPTLMDGGGCTAASFGIMDTDGQWVVENVGVAPDVEVIQWPKQVAAGGDPQLEKAVEIALELLEKNPPKERPGYTPPTKR
jgi:tricorn protease